MHVMQVTDDRRLARAERPEPEVGPAEVRVAVAFCGICGSDLHMRSDPAIPEGAVLGHEFSGVVQEVGRAVEGWQIGDRVAVLPYVSCGSCRYCRAGAENFCMTGGHLGSVLGVDRPGGLSESVVADQSALLRLTGDATLEQGALVEPVAVAVRAAGRVVAGPEEPVVVMGAGPIGLLVGLVLTARGYAEVTVGDLNDGRLAVAENLGLRTFAATTEGLGELLSRHDAGTFVDCTGAPPAIRAEVAAVRARGRVVLVGLPSGDLAYDAADAILREVEVVGSAGYSRSDFAAALDLLASGALPTDRLITKVAGLEDADALFDELSDPATLHIKILVQV